MKKFTAGIFLFILTFAYAACRKPYSPPAIKNQGGYLVVDGVVNAGPDSTFIKLSYAVSIANKAVSNPASGARVTVESDNGQTYTLTEKSAGTYTFPGLNLDYSRQYRLRIKTSNNIEYLSDYVPALKNPAIDTVGLNVVNAPQPGIEVYVNTHDPTGN